MRRELAQRIGDLREVASLSIFEALLGYGERPWRVIGASFIVIFGLSFVYLDYSYFAFSDRGLEEFWSRFKISLYFSGLSFTALGYGNWVSPTPGWTRYLGPVESLVGVLLLALFLVTFLRKMLR